MSAKNVSNYLWQWAKNANQLVFYILSNVLGFIIIFGPQYFAFTLDYIDYNWTNWLQVIFIFVSFNISGLVWTIDYLARYKRPDKGDINAWMNYLYVKL